MSYREAPVPGLFRQLAECLWVSDGARRARVLPDGCMDLIAMNDTVVVAGPDTAAFVSDTTSSVATGIRFRPGVLPRLLGVPASEVRNTRVALHELRPDAGHGPLLARAARLLARDPSRETGPWPLEQLHHVTRRFAEGAEVRAVADEIGWSARNLQRQSAAVYGYSPAMLRRILRFRRAVDLLHAGRSIACAAAMAGYADQSHLHRQTRNLAGVPVGQLFSGAYRSTDVPSGSTTVA